jgi:hypothetical protein
MITSPNKSRACVKTHGVEKTSLAFDLLCVLTKRRGETTEEADSQNESPTPSESCRGARAPAKLFTVCRAGFPTCPLAAHQ